MRTLCISDLQFLETIQNWCLFCTFSLLRNFYSGDAHHAKYGKHSWNHHFRHCAHCVYHLYSVLKVLEIAVCFPHFGFYEISTPVIRTMPTMVNVVQIIISDIAHTVYNTFTVFWNFSKLLFVLHIFVFRKFILRWCPQRYGKHSFNHHFRRCAPCLYQIYSVLKLFEIAVGFEHFGFYKISTPVMRTMLTMLNVVQIIISEFAHILYITFTVFWNFSKMLFILHIFVFTKFLLRWGAPC